MAKQYFTYILTSQKNGTLYIGITDNLARRLEQHRIGTHSAFTAKYHVHRLVYYEIFDNPADALHREKCIKKWKRDWKLTMIERSNPNWTDLSEQLLD